MTTKILEGASGKAFVEKAEIWKAGFTVVGLHGDGFWKHASPGSASDKIVHHAPYAVLVVRGAKNAENRALETGRNMASILILGGGFGGLTANEELSERLGGGGRRIAPVAPHVNSFFLSAARPPRFPNFCYKITHCRQMCNLNFFIDSI